VKPLDLLRTVDRAAKNFDRRPNFCCRRQRTVSRDGSFERGKIGLDAGSIVERRGSSGVNIDLEMVVGHFEPSSAARGMETRRLNYYLWHASITSTVRYTAMSPQPLKHIWRS
jgi:hypothetical protein